jgi:uncharacterized phage protein (TIGR02220 family)
VKIKVINWSKYHPRADYKKIIWFKVYVDIFNSPGLFGITPAQKWFWIYLIGQAAKNRGAEFSLNVDYSSYQTGVDAEEIKSALKHFEKSSMISMSIPQDVNDSDPCLRGMQRRIKKEEEEEEVRKKRDILSFSASQKSDAVSVLEFLNEKTGKAFRPVDSNLKLIAARLKSGASVQDCFTVIARKNREWGSDPKMAQYLRPATLFSATNFEQYLGECVVPKGLNT